MVGNDGCFPKDLAVHAGGVVRGSSVQEVVDPFFYILCEVSGPDVDRVGSR